MSPAIAGYRLEQGEWLKEIPGVGHVAIAPLDWRHAHLPAFIGRDDRSRTLDALGFLVELQRQTWGMVPEDLTPANLLAVIPDTGGAVLVAYDRRTGFNADGWLGFVFGLGARSSELVSHMLGVRPDLRGAAGIGWALKLAQAHAAATTGHTAMNWTFDPMRAGNARLNIAKLGAVVEELTIDKYGVLATALYGDVPSDRFIAHWEFQSPAVVALNESVARGEIAGPSIRDALALPALTTETAERLAADRPRRIAYEIPSDVDLLMQTDPRRAVAWRSDARTLLSAFLTTNCAVADRRDVGPTSVAIASRPGDYVIDCFVTGLDESGARRAFYLLTRKDAR